MIDYIEGREKVHRSVVQQRHRIAWQQGRGLVGLQHLLIVNACCVSGPGIPEKAMHCKVSGCRRALLKGGGRPISRDGASGNGSWRRNRNPRHWRAASRLGGFWGALQCILTPDRGVTWTASATAGSQACILFER